LSKRILITGASGFVGANLARRALRDGHEVHLLLRPGYRTWRLDEIAGHLQLHEADLADDIAVRAAVRGIRPDWVFHLAAYGAYSSQKDVERMVATNLSGCISLLDACVESGVEAFVNAGSSSEYGLKDHAPDEDEALEPNSPYAITKAAATHYCRLKARETGIHAATVRLYSVYGPYEEPNRLIPSLVVHGLNGKFPPLVSPETARDFVYVDDAVDAMIRIAASAVPPGSINNVCSGVQVKLRDAVETARQLMGVEAEPDWGTMAARSWDTDVWVGTGARLIRELGWRVSTSFADGLKKTLAWFRTHPELLRYYAAAKPVTAVHREPTEPTI
jgi:dolichol-phosphate mannosyltransferase